MPYNQFEYNESEYNETGFQEGTVCLPGLGFRDYVLRLGFKRTDKDQELYEATTDAIQEMRREFGFSEAETEIASTDTIETLGEFKIDVEEDLGLLVGIVVEDEDDTGVPLVGMSKKEFDDRYPEINVDNALTGFPKNFTVFADEIRIGPKPDKTSYVYRLTYSTIAHDISAETECVPFTKLYRDVLGAAVLAKLYEGLDEFERAGYWRARYEYLLAGAKRREKMNSSRSCFKMKQRDC